MTSNRDLRVAQQAAEQAAEQFAHRGQADEWAVSRLMADRYRKQLTNEEAQPCTGKARTR